MEIFSHPYLRTSTVCLHSTALSCNENIRLGIANQSRDVVKVKLVEVSELETAYLENDC